MRQKEEGAAANDSPQIKNETRLFAFVAHETDPAKDQLSAHGAKLTLRRSSDRRDRLPRPNLRPLRQPCSTGVRR